MARMTRRRFLALVAGSALAAAAAAVGLAIPSLRRGGQTPLPQSVKYGTLGEDYLDRFQHDVVAKGLEVPWAVLPLGGDDYLVTERPGRITLVSRGRLKVVAKPRVASEGEAGLLGLAPHPDFPGERTIYTYMTVETAVGLENRIVEYRLSPDMQEARPARTLLSGIPGARLHDGGRLKLGPDGMLYATTGDALEPRLSQSLESLAGKILRIDLEGGPPPDNPFPESPVYSLGHRNPQGLDWHRESGRLYSSEHGPVGRDELNEIVPGGNYGWPDTAGLEGEWRESYVKPVIDFGDESIAPSGASFVARGLGKMEGDLLIACLRARMLVHVAFNSRGEALAYEYMLRGKYGRLRDVVPHPDGGVVIATSNRDGRGNPAPGDDKLIWIH